MRIASSPSPGAAPIGARSSVLIAGSTLSPIKVRSALARPRWHASWRLRLQRTWRWKRLRTTLSLSDFYHDKARHPLATQVYFLAQRAQQPRHLVRTYRHGISRISDFLVAKDRLFARITLNPHELTLYDQLPSQFLRSEIEPDLVTYLHAAAQVLLARICARRHKLRGPAYLHGVECFLFGALRRARPCCHAHGRCCDERRARESSVDQELVRYIRVGCFSRQRFTARDMNFLNASNPMFRPHISPTASARTLPSHNG